MVKRKVTSKTLQTLPVQFSPEWKRLAAIAIQRHEYLDNSAGGRLAGVEVGVKRVRRDWDDTTQCLATVTVYLADDKKREVYDDCDYPLHWVEKEMLSGMRRSTASARER